MVQNNHEAMNSSIISDQPILSAEVLFDLYQQVCDALEQFESMCASGEIDAGALVSSRGALYAQCVFVFSDEDLLKLFPDFVGRPYNAKSSLDD